MNTEEAIEILQEEHDWCQEPFYVIKALEIAIAALRAQQEREKNEPITPEELFEMVGEPIVINNCWFFLEKIDHRTAYCYRWCYDFADEYPINEYGQTWLAYRHKPKEGD